MDIVSLKPGIAILTSMIATVAILLSGRAPNLRETWTLLAAIVKFLVVISMLPEVRTGTVVSLELLEISPNLALAFRVDALGMVFGLLASGLWIFTSIYSIGYMRSLNEHKQTRYFASFALSVSAALGVAFAGNLLTLVIFFEMLTFATYPLVIHKETPEAFAAGRKYLAYTIPGGVAMVIATGWTYLLAGTLELRPGGILAGSGNPAELIPLFALFVLGFGVKAALMPLQGWLPTAMIAPTPVSALLHAVAVVKAGVFTGLRIVGFTFGPELLRELGISLFLAALAGITLLLASLIAMKQDHLKSRLAYSTVAHLSYILLGTALLSPTAWMGAVFHMVNHALMKITLFFCAGAIHATTHRDYVSELDGIGRRLPLTMGAFGLASLGLAGLPPIGGFLSKWYLGIGSVEAGVPVFGWVLLASGILNAAYLFPIVYRAFFRAPAEAAGRKDGISGEDPAGENATTLETTPLALAMVVPLVLTALCAFAFGIIPDRVSAFWELSLSSTLEVMGRGIAP